MDILSHGLWGGLVFGRKSEFLARLRDWLAPDLFSFGILWSAATRSV